MKRQYLALCLILCGPARGLHAADSSPVVATVNGIGVTQADLTAASVDLHLSTVELNLVRSAALTRCAHDIALLQLASRYGVISPLLTSLQSAIEEDARRDTIQGQPTIYGPRRYSERSRRALWLERLEHKVIKARRGRYGEPTDSAALEFYLGHPALFTAPEAPSPAPFETEKQHVKTVLEEFQFHEELDEAIKHGQVKLEP